MIEMFYFFIFLFMRSVNKVIFLGYLATEPELKEVGNYTLCRFKIALHRDWRAADGEKHQSTDYQTVVAWQKLAKLSHEYLRKGAGVYVEGRLSKRKYQARDGSDRYVTEVVADTILFVSFGKSKEHEEVNLKEVEEISV